MDFEDSLIKEQIRKEAERLKPIRNSKEVTRSVIAQIRSTQSQNDILAFGLLKIWTILLELFSALYVQYKMEVDMKQRRLP